MPDQGYAQGRDQMVPIAQPHQFTGNMGNAAIGLVEEEEVKKRLEKRGIPEEDWLYYIESPHSWDYSEIAPSSLCKGVEVVLLSPTTCTPGWVKRGSLNRFIQLRGKLKKLMQAKSEMEKFLYWTTYYNRS